MERHERRQPGVGVEAGQGRVHGVVGLLDGGRHQAAGRESGEPRGGRVDLGGERLQQRRRRDALHQSGGAIKALLDRAEDEPGVELIEVAAQHLDLSLQRVEHAAHLVLSRSEKALEAADDFALDVERLERGERGGDRELLDARQRRGVDRGQARLQLLDLADDLLGDGSEAELLDLRRELGQLGGCLGGGRAQARHDGAGLLEHAADRLDELVEREIGDAGGELLDGGPGGLDDLGRETLRHGCLDPVERVVDPRGDASQVEPHDLFAQLGEQVARRLDGVLDRQRVDRAAELGDRGLERVRQRRERGVRERPDAGEQPLEQRRHVVRRRGEARQGRQLDGVER